MPQFTATQQLFTTKFGHHENGNDKPTCDFDTKNDFKSDSNDSRIKIFLVRNEHKHSIIAEIIEGALQLVSVT